MKQKKNIKKMAIGFASGLVLVIIVVVSILLGQGAPMSYAVAETDVYTGRVIDTKLNVSAIDHGNTITLSWTARPCFDKYIICRSTNGVVEPIAETSASSIELERLPGVNIFLVEPVDPAGTIYDDSANKISIGAESKTIDIDLRIIEKGADYVTLAWDPEGIAGPYALGYVNNEWRTLYATTDETVCRVDGLSAGEYRFEISFMNNTAVMYELEHAAIETVIGK